MKKIDDKINTLQAVHTRKPKITPNHITILHILLLIPLFFLLKSRLWIPSAISFLVTGILDLLDGYMARKWKMETALGKILDPLADKLGTILVLIFLIIYTPNQFRITFIALIAIEAMFFILSLIMIASGKKLMIKKTNKISMFLMFIILDSYLFIHGLQDSSPVILFYILILISLSRIVTLLTTLIYYLKNQNF